MDMTKIIVIVDWLIKMATSYIEKIEALLIKSGIMTETTTTDVAETTTVA